MMNLQKSQKPIILQPRLKCLLGCNDPEILLMFPRDKETRKLWLDRIGLTGLPCGMTRARICNFHFSERMYSGGLRLKPDAIPDINLPIRTEESTSDDEISFVEPNTGKQDWDKVLGTKPVVITSRHSKCFLKCKDAKSTYRLPKDKQALQIWMKRLGLKKMPPRSRTARICQIHFSPRMFTPGKGRRLTSCAIPDMNLPAQTVFEEEDKSDDEELVDVYTEILSEDFSDEGDNNEDNTEDSITENLNVPTSPVREVYNLDIVNNVVQVPESMLDQSPQEDEEIHELFRAVMKTPTNDDPFATKIIGCPEVLINSIENIKSAVNSTTSKEGILHVFQPGIDSKPEDKDENNVVLPDNVYDADSECVLKCSHGDRLFKFPNTETQRRLWLDKIGLTHCFFNTKICDRHFSRGMFIKSGKRLARFAFPDINLPKPAQPRIQDPAKSLKNYRMILPTKQQYNVVELPQYICVLTILKGHTEVDAVVNGIKYIRHKVDENIPKREREIQVNATDIVQTASVGISPDDEYVEDFNLEEESKVEDEKKDWISTFKSHVLSSKADMYECLVCGEISAGYACNLKHSDIHKESSALCFQCGQLFSNQYLLKAHEKDVHFNGLKVLRCPRKYCNKAFRSRKLLHLHIDEHARFRQYFQYKCSKCSRQFGSLLRLHSHQLACRSNFCFRYSRRFIRNKVH